MSGVFAQNSAVIIESVWGVSPQWLANVVAIISGDGRHFWRAVHLQRRSHFLPATTAPYSHRDGSCATIRLLCITVRVPVRLRLRAAFHCQPFHHDGHPLQCTVGAGSFSNVLRTLTPYFPSSPCCRRRHHCHRHRPAATTADDKPLILILSLT
jgi:hypothetical protein